MRRRSRTRRVLKWVGLGVCLVFLIWWPISHRRGVGWQRAYPDRNWLGARKGKCFRISVGQVVFVAGTTGLGYRTGFYSFRVIMPCRLRYRLWPYYCNSRGGWYLSIPLWCFIVVAGLPAACLSWRDHHRFPPGHCQKCGYDLTGNVSGRCPECGAHLR